MPDEERLDVDLLDEDDPFEIDDQAAHLFKHEGLGIEDVYEVWESDPLFYPAIPPADWLLVAEVGGEGPGCPGCQARQRRPDSVSPDRLLSGSRPACRSLPRRQMTTNKDRTMNRDEEHEFYKDPEHQVPQGPPRRRKKPLTRLVPVRFSDETLEEIRRLADADDRSISSWIRQAVDHEIEAKRPA